MRRRSFLGGLGAALATALGVRGFAHSAEAGRAVTLEEAIRQARQGGPIIAPYDPTVADRNGKGSCLSRIYRLATDGCYYEIGRAEPKPGDRCIVLGLDGKRLWSAEAFTVAGPRGSYFHDGEPVLEVAGTPVSVNLFRDGL